MLRNIDELSDENLQSASEYGSESMSSQRRTPVGADSTLASRLKAVALRQSFHKLERDNQFLISPTKSRPSIFDLQKTSSLSGHFKVTHCDKTIKCKRVRNSQQYSEENVLGDLLISLLSRNSMLKLNSDYELNQGHILFCSMLEKDPKCHEAMFGLGRINYVQGRYELAERCFIKSYEGHRDFTYRVWLGFTQLKLASICTAENPKKFRYAQNAFMNMDRCSRDVKVGLYANYCLLKLASDFYGETKLPNLQEPSYYAILIKSDFSPLRFEGTLA